MSKYLGVILLLSSCSLFQKQSDRSTSSVSETAISTNSYTCDNSIYFKSNSLKTCHIKTVDSGKKSFHLLQLKGNEIENSYAQGYLLASEIEDGTINDMLREINDLTASNPKMAWLLNSIKDCYVGRMKRSVSDQFMEQIHQLSQGYQDGIKKLGRKPKFNDTDFVIAVLGIDLGNIVGGLAHELEENPVKGAADLIGACGLKITKAAVIELFDGYHEKNPTEDHKMGCVGVASSAVGTIDHKLIHGRNFDQTPLISTWSKHPVMYLVDEPGFHKYMGTGTAGLIFPAGISGMNDQGLSVSLHQMNTTRFDSLHRNKKAMIMPYLQQIIIKKAKSIDEAYKIIQDSEVFASWTVFISDAKTNELASIEISPNKKVIARRNINSFMGQSNHFINADMQKQHYHDSYNNLLETHSRLNITEKALKNQFSAIDLDWMMNHLSLHEDFYEGSRSFGRTPVKVSNIMSTIAIPADATYWMTIGDRRPASHSTYFGAKADWLSGQLIPIGSTKTHQFRNTPEYEKSFDRYVEAYLNNNKGDYLTAIQNLKEAISLSNQDGKNDFTYRYNLARLLQMTEQYNDAFGIFLDLWKNKEQNHIYQQALISMHLARTAELLSNENKWSSEKTLLYYNFSLSTFERLKSESYKGHATSNLKKKIKLITKWKKGKDAPIPKLNFSVVD